MSAPSRTPDRTISIAGDFVVGRIGYGAMQLTKPQVWGEYQDRDGAIKLVRERSCRGAVGAHPVSVSSCPVRPADQIVIKHPNDEGGVPVFGMPPCRVSDTAPVGAVAQQTRHADRATRARRARRRGYRRPTLDCGGLMLGGEKHMPRQARDDHRPA